jgi:hypothetical protein
MCVPIYFTIKYKTPPEENFWRGFGLHWGSNRAFVPSTGKLLMQIGHVELLIANQLGPVDCGESGHAIVVISFANCFVRRQVVDATIVRQET